MIKIKERNYQLCEGHEFDFLLENGVLLHETEFNGEDYCVKENDNTETIYHPVYDENENVNGGFDIIGFED